MKNAHAWEKEADGDPVALARMAADAWVALDSAARAAYTTKPPITGGARRAKLSTLAAWRLFQKEIVFSLGMQQQH